MLFVGALIGMFDVRRPMLDVQCRMCGVVLRRMPVGYQWFLLLIWQWQRGDRSCRPGGGNVEKATAGLDPLPLLSRRGRRPSIWHECSQWCDVRRVDAQAMRLNKARNQHPFSF